MKNEENRMRDERPAGPKSLTGNTFSKPMRIDGLNMPLLRSSICLGLISTKMSRLRRSADVTPAASGRCHACGVRQMSRLRRSADVMPTASGDVTPTAFGRCHTYGVWQMSRLRRLAGVMPAAPGIYRAIMTGETVIKKTFMNSPCRDD
jgi:hypothetical protein